MPELTDINGELRRRSLVAVAMLASLVVAIGLASMASGTRHVVVAGPAGTVELELDIPSGWQRVLTATPIPPPAHWRTCEIFQSDAGERHTLIVAGMDLGRPVTPNNAMALALRGLSARGKGTSHELIQVGDMVGRLFRGWDEVVIGGHQFIWLHMVAALTNDGEYYHLIYLRKLVQSTGVQPNQHTYPNTTFHRIYRSAIDQHLQAAQKHHIHAAGFVLQAPRGMRAVVQPGHLLGDGVMLLHDVATRHLRTTRVLGIADPGGQTPSDPLWPGALLQAQFIAITGRGPAADETGENLLAAIPHWWTQLGRPSEGAKIIRRLAYFRLSGQRGLLLDVLAEPDGFKAHWQRANELVTEIRRTIDSTPVDPLVAVDGAIRRGEIFAERQMSMITQLLKQDARPYRLTSMGYAYGYEVHQSLAANFQRSLPLAGLIHRRTEGQAPCETKVAWMASTDGTECQWHSGTTCATGGARRRPAHVRQSQLRIDTNEIRLETAADGQARTAWTAALPTPFMIPPMQDRWPAGLLSNPDALPCLVWSCDTRRGGPPRPPIPAWIERQIDPPAPGITSDDTSLATPLLVLRHRPIMCLKADLAYLNADGAIVGYTMRCDAGWNRGAGAILATATQWPDVLREIQERRNAGAWGWIQNLLRVVSPPSESN